MFGVALGHRVLKTTLDAELFEKNLASNFANEKRTVVASVLRGIDRTKWESLKLKGFYR